MAALAARAAGLDCTQVRPAEFMGNARFWAESIRAEGVVRAPFGGRPHAMVHEADVAAVVVAALLEPGHAGRTHRPTGPAALTRAEAVQVIGTALGRRLRFVELTESQGREQLRAAGSLEDVVAAIIEYGRNPPADAHTVLPTVEQVTGRPARTFAEWVGEHVAAFGAPAGAARGS